MNVWDALFTTHPTEPPQFGFTWYASTFALLFLTIYLAYRYRDSKVCQRFFQIIQAIQLISLYSWYWINQFPLSESLPFYHCRLAMFVVLLLPGVSKTKQYFALLGTFTHRYFVLYFRTSSPSWKFLDLSFKQLQCSSLGFQRYSYTDLFTQWFDFYSQFIDGWRLRFYDKTTIGGRPWSCG